MRIEFEDGAFFESFFYNCSLPHKCPTPQLGVILQTVTSEEERVKRTKKMSNEDADLELELAIALSLADFDQARSCVREASDPRSSFNMHA